MQIQTKLILTLTVLSALLCASLFFLVQWSFDRGMLHYINQREKDNHAAAVQALSTYYREYRTWAGLAQDRRAYDRLIKFQGPGGNKRYFSDRRPPREHPPERRFFDREEHRPPPRERFRPPRKGGPPPTLLDARKRIITGKFNSDFILTPINMNGETVGWLAIPPPPHALDDTNLKLNENFQLAFIIVVVVVGIAILFIGIPLSQHFVFPLKKITAAAHALTCGQYPEKFSFSRKDEIGQLARDFEELTATLKAAETSRSRWIADISHELRTPLSIALGEVEAMLEQVRPLTPENLDSVKQEIQQLNRLVNDLYELSNAEIGALRYNKEDLDLIAALKHAIQRFDHPFIEKGFELQVNVPEQAIWLHADVQRLNQLFNNLFGNEVKYANDNATVKIMLTTNKASAFLIIEDSGPGVPDGEINKLFDYIYRVESSRNRKLGGSGLGLSICKRIVGAHHGSIECQPSDLGGLKFTIQFPLKK